MPTIKDVAEHAGVSVTTVSRVMNDRGSISNKTRKKVYKTMEEIGYRPNEVARSLLLKRTKIIGLIVPFIDHPFFSMLTQYIERACASSGLKLMICASNHDLKVEREFTEMLKANRVDGIILCSRTEDSSHFRNIDLPIITIERTIDEHVPSVECDNYHGGELAARKLIEGGSSYLALFSNRVSSPHLPAKFRIDGFINECEKQRVEYTPLYIDEEDLFVSDFRHYFGKLLADHPEIDGIFATGDILAARALTACASYGRKVPEDIAIVGFDNTSIAEFFEISAISQPIGDMAKSAVELLKKKINGDLIAHKSIYPVSYVTRRTTR